MKKNSFVEGTIIASLSIIFIKILGALYVIPFYKIIGEDGGSLYSYAYNIYNLFLTISITGFPVAVSKIISEYNEKKMYQAKDEAYKISKVIIGFLAIISFAITFIFSEEIAYLFIGNLTGGNSISDISLVIKVISFSLLIIPFLSITRGYLQGHKYITPSTNSQIYEQLIRIFIVLVGSYLAINVMNKSITTGVAVALTGSLFGGLFADIYLHRKIKVIKAKEKKNDEVKVFIETKEIVKKFFFYALPSIFISLLSSIYDITDQILILRGSSYLGYSTLQSETIASIISTWGVKICMIISAIGSAISINVIPHMVESFVKKDTKLMAHRLNQVLSLSIIISLPLAIGVYFLRYPIYTLFYGESAFGPKILGLAVFVVVLGNINSVLNTCFLSINQNKIIYINTILSVVLNLVMDLPLMFLFNYLGLFPIWGASTSTLISTFIAIVISLILLKRKYHIDYQDFFQTIKKMICPIIMMIIPLIIFNFLYDFTSHNNLLNFFVMIGYSLVGASIYFFVGYKNGLLKQVLGENYIKEILNKLPKRKEVN